MYVRRHTTTIKIDNSGYLITQGGGAPPLSSFQRPTPHAQHALVHLEVSQANQGF